MPLASPDLILREIARRVYAPTPRVFVDEWADKHRVLIERAAAEPGRWRTARTPYLRRVMRAFTTPGVRQITFRKCSQVGGTECINNILGYIVDVDPGPTLLVYPSFRDAQEVFRDRLLPTLRATPAVARHLSDLREDAAGLHLKFDRMDLWVVGSNSASRLRSKPIRYAIVDEVDVCEPSTVDELLQRGATFDDFRLVCVGTPSFEMAGIDALLQVSTNERFCVPCPLRGCGFFQELDFRRLRWHGGLGPEGIKADRHHLESIERPKNQSGGTWYECVKCRGALREHHKPGMLAAGVWVAEGEEVEGGKAERRKDEEAKHHASHLGFRISALYSPFPAVTWGRIAREWVEQRGRPTRVWLNGVLGLPQKSRGLGLKLEQLKGLRVPLSAGGYRMGRVPAWVYCLIGTVDVQADRAYVAVWGFSPGARDMCLVHCGSVNTPVGTQLVQLDPLITRAWGVVVPGDLQQRVDRSVRCLVWGCDSGHRTNEVYAAVRRWSALGGPAAGRSGGGGRRRLCYALKGASVRVPGGVVTSRVDRTTDGRPIAGGVRLVLVDGMVWKESLAGRMRASLGLSGGEDENEAETRFNSGENPEEKSGAIVQSGREGRVGDRGEEEGDRRQATEQGAAFGGGVGVGVGVGGGRLFLPENTPDEFLAHMVSEELVTESRGRQVVRFWRPRVLGARNDWWDCGNYAEALAGVVGMVRQGVRGPNGQMAKWSNGQTEDGAPMSGDGGGGVGGASGGGLGGRAIVRRPGARIRSGYR